MRIALIQIGWALHEKFPTWAKDSLIAAIIDDPVFGEKQKVPQFEEIEGNPNLLIFNDWHIKLVVDIDKMPQIPFEVLAISKLTYRTIADDIESRGTAPINERANLMVPGSFLSDITEVKVVYDFCTDMLQTEISQGWRILAICPQPDQRRPDYILGKKP